MHTEDERESSSAACLKCLRTAKLPVATYFLTFASRWAL
ncbi:unnamed protein product, partial [Pieris macdunnoughi]